MSSELSPQHELFLQEALQRGVFPSRQQALDEAVELLQRRTELLRTLDEGIRQIENGKGIAVQGETELGSFFDGIKSEGRANLDPHRTVA